MNPLQIIIINYKIPFINIIKHYFGEVMKRILCVITFSLILNGCASRANLEWNLNAWIGHDVDGLIQHWGDPVDVSGYSNGDVSYIWLFDDGLSNSPIKGTIDTLSKYCKISIDVSSEYMVQSWKLEGNDCKA